MTESPSLAAFQRTPAPGLSTWHGRALVTYLADAAETGGAYALLEAVLRPGLEPPPHTHSREDELFYVLDGGFDVYSGPEHFAVQRGGSVFLPRGTPHAFIIRSPRLHVLTLFTPGGIEAAFRASSIPAATLDLPPAAPGADGPPPPRGRLTELGVSLLSPAEIAAQLPLYHQAKLGTQP